MIYKIIPHLYFFILYQNFIYLSLFLELLFYSIDIFPSDSQAIIICSSHYSFISHISVSEDNFPFIITNCLFIHMHLKGIPSVSEKWGIVVITVLYHQNNWKELKPYNLIKLFLPGTNKTCLFNSSFLNNAFIFFIYYNVSYYMNGIFSQLH